MAERNMNLYDVVIPLKEQSKHIDLLYTLRALDKFGGDDIRNVFVIGDCPKWIKNVIHIPSEQACGDKYIATRLNRDVINNCPLISQDYIYFNDDFILSKPVKSWEELCNVNCGTLAEREEINKSLKPSLWRSGFTFNRELLQKLGVDNPLNFEFHGAMIFNQQKRNELKTIKEIKKHWLISDPLLFERSLYGNLFGRTDGRKIRDNKLFSDISSEEILLENGFFSVADNLINSEEAPNLNTWLKRNFCFKSCFEKLAF